MTARQVVRQLLAKRFGTLPDDLLQRIESATDVDRLMDAALQVSDLATPDELQL